MTIRNLVITRIVCVALTVAVMALVSTTSAVSQTPVDNLYSARGVPVQAHSYARANYIWPYSTGPHYPAIDIYQQGVIWTTV